MLVCGSVVVCLTVNTSCCLSGGAEAGLDPPSFSSSPLLPPFLTSFYFFIPVFVLVFAVIVFFFFFNKIIFDVNLWFVFVNIKCCFCSAQLSDKMIINGQSSSLAVVSFGPQGGAAKQL